MIAVTELLAPTPTFPIRTQKCLSIALLKAELERS